MKFKLTFPAAFFSVGQNKCGDSSIQSLSWAGLIGGGGVETEGVDTEDTNLEGEGN